MQGKINGQSINIKLTSVVLESDPENPDMFLMFHCPKDGKSMFQYSARVVMIVPGKTDTKLPIIKMCGFCKTRYLINSIL